ncbi:MAG: glycosyltransferase family 39 protein, partial [bacterium]
HPPVYFMLLQIWMKVAPETESWLRLLSLLFSILTLFPLYSLVKRVAGREAGLWTCVFVSLSAFHHQFAAELRMYSMLEFLAVMTTDLLVRVEEAEDKPGRRVFILKGLYFALSVVMLYVHYYGAFVLLSHAIFLVAWRGRDLGKRWLPVFAGIAVFFLPWSWNMLHQAGDKRLVWITEFYPSGVSFPAVLSTLQYFGVGEWEALEGAAKNVPFFCLFLPLLIMGSVVSLRRGWLRSTANAGRATCLSAQPLLVLLLIVPFVCLIGISFFKPLFTPRYMISTLPFYFALIAVGLRALPSRTIRLVVGAAVVAGLLFAFPDMAASRPRQDWLGIAKLLKEKIPKDALDKTLVLHTREDTKFCLDYYFQRREFSLPTGINIVWGGGKPFTAEDSQPIYLCVLLLGERLDARTDLTQYLSDYVHEGTIPMRRRIYLEFFHLER